MMDPTHRLEADGQVRKMVKGVEQEQCGAPDDRLDFNKDVLGKPGNLYSGTRWLVVTEIPGVDGVDLFILGERCEEDLFTAPVHLDRRLVPVSEMGSVPWF
jgi:hypothetical protein